MIELDVRSIDYVKRVTLIEENKLLPEPIKKAAALVTITNPFANKGYVEDLSQLFDLGAAAGALVTDELKFLVGGKVASYGKGAIVGLGGHIEHGAACIHPKLGAPMRKAIGGGKALIPSNCKVGGVGTAIDIPLGNKDDIWSFPSFDTMTLNLVHAPLDIEIVVIVAYASGGRSIPRVGRAPLTSAKSK